MTDPRIIPDEELAEQVESVSRFMETARENIEQYRLAAEKAEAERDEALEQVGVLEDAYMLAQKSAVRRKARAVAGRNEVEAEFAAYREKARQRLADRDAMIAQARQWISTCVDPIAVGHDVKQRMLDALRSEDGS